MKRLLFILPIIAMAFVLSGCTAMMSMSAYGTSDLYKTDNRAEVATRLKNEAEVARLEAEARQAQWEARLAEANASAAEAEYYAVVNQQPNYSNVVADDYQSAYARRLYGFQSPTYRMPSSYYNMLNSSSIYYVTAYDPAYYNIMVSGDQVWVEPKYITSMFGSWGATNVTFGIYASPWNYGWSYRVDPFYYSMWGYPHYSWYDWNWNMCYNPFYYDWYWGGYYPHHHHHHHHHHHPVPPPSHRPDNRPGYHPDHTTGSGASVGPGNMNGNRVNTGSRYTSPTSNRNYGATDSRGNSRPTSGSTSQGFNSSSVRPSTGTSKDSRFNVVESNTRVNTSVGAASNSNTTKSSGGNFRQSTSQNSGTRTTISSGSSRVGTSSSSGSSRSSSSSNFRTSSSSSNSSSSFRSSSSSSSSSSSRSSSGSFRSSGSSSGSSSSGSFRSSGSSSGSSRR